MQEASSSKRLLSSSSEESDDHHVIDCSASDGITLSFSDLKYEVEEQKQEGFCNGRFSREKKMKQIIKGISACCPAGSMTAIMGPSGCGKSSLLDVLAGRIKSRFLQGSLLINGAPIDFKSLKKDAAYVTQDDTLAGVLTVYENLWYAAMLKLPQDMPIQDKENRIKEVISDLGLTKTRDTKVGNWMYRGVSGGERRRVSIGVEIITKPTLLLLDEPTSGLDSLSARMLIELLQTMCRSEPKRTILMTIHQPSSYVFALYDNLLLLSEGHQIWYGNHRLALKHFKEAGLPLGKHVNPADVYLEAVNVSFMEADQKEPHLKNLTSAWDASAQKKKLTCYLAEREANSSKFVGTGPQYFGQFADFCTHNHKYNTSAWYQTWILAQRFFWMWLRDFGVFWARLAMYVMIAIMMGTEYLRMDMSQDRLQDRMSILFFSCAFLVFMSVAAVPAFIEERGIFIRERSNAYYSVGPYALANSIVSIPFVFIIAASFTAISYYLMGMNESVYAFWYFMADLFLALLTAEGMITSISALSPSYIIGIAMGAGIYGMCMINQGFFLRADYIPGWWIWVHYGVVHKYSFEGFMVNEFMGQEFDCLNTTAPNATVPTCFCSYRDLNGDCKLQGSEILTEFGYQDIDKFAWLGVMVSMAVIWRVIFYVLLLVFNKGKR